MQNFQDTFETLVRNHFSVFSICMTVPLTLFFLSNPILFNGQSDQKTKRGLELVASCSSDYKTNSEKFLY